MSLPAQWMVFTNQNANTGLPELCIFFQQTCAIFGKLWLELLFKYLIYFSMQIFFGFTFNTKLLSIFKVATPERRLFCLQMNWNREQIDWLIYIFLLIMSLIEKNWFVILTLKKWECFLQQSGLDICCKYALTIIIYLQKKNNFHALISRY